MISSTGGKYVPPLSDSEKKDCESKGGQVIAVRNVKGCVVEQKCIGSSGGAVKTPEGPPVAPGGSPSSWTAGGQY